MKSRVIKYGFLICFCFINHLRAEILIDEQSFEWWHRDPSWTVALKRPITLLIKNPGGGVRVSTSSGEGLGLSLPVISRMSEDHQKVTVKVEELTPDKLAVSASYPVPIPAAEPLLMEGLLLPVPVAITGDALLDIHAELDPPNPFKGAHLEVNIPDHLLVNLSVVARGEILIHDIVGEPEKPRVIHAQSELSTAKVARVEDAELLLLPNRIRLNQCKGTVQTIGHGDRIRELF